MNNLYPTIKTYNTFQLEVQPPHKIYIEECGNPDGIPLLVLHDGPGTGCTDTYRRFFEPRKYRIILFDQRGAGRSSPYTELKNNNTHHLLDDIEKIRQHLKIDQFVLFGNAWGATLSLLYAQLHPEHVISLILVSTFLARSKDIYWLYNKGANYIFPDYWNDFINHFNNSEKHSIIKSYHERLTGTDDLARMSMAKAWAMWKARCLSFHPHNKTIEYFSNPHIAIGLATIETHYLLNKYFIEDNQILDNIKTIKNIPGFIIHGRYDMISPLESAWELNKLWGNSELFIVRDAGHATTNAGLIDAIIIATNQVAEITTQ